MPEGPLLIPLNAFGYVYDTLDIFSGWKRLGRGWCSAYPPHSGYVAHAAAAAARRAPHTATCRRRLPHLLMIINA